MSTKTVNDVLTSFYFLIDEDPTDTRFSSTKVINLMNRAYKILVGEYGIETYHEEAIGAGSRNLSYTSNSASKPVCVQYYHGTQKDILDYLPSVDQLSWNSEGSGYPRYYTLFDGSLILDLYVIEAGTICIWDRVSPTSISGTGDIFTSVPDYLADALADHAAYVIELGDGNVQKAMEHKQSWISAMNRYGAEMRNKSYSNLDQVRVVW